MIGRSSEVRNVNNNDRPLKDIVQELKTEARDFVNTRVAMLKAEISEKIAHMKAAAPMMVAALVFAWGAFLTLTFGLVALIAAFMENPYRWAIAAGIIFLVYGIIAALLGWFGYKEIQTEGLAPQRTMRVLKQDQDWLKNEARTA
jgi:uncharacterized membrane protein YqjE